MFMSLEMTLIIILICFQAYIITMIYWLREDYTKVKRENDRLLSKIMEVEFNFYKEKHNE